MGIKISNLPAIVTPALTDVFPVVQSGVTYKETFTQFSSLFATAGANTNITSLGGLTTPLSIAQGGTGRTTAPTPTVQRFLTGAGTYTTPAGVLYLRVVAVGGGGGGSGSSDNSNNGGAGGNGGNTTFGAVISCGGGGGGQPTAVAAGGTGGTVTLTGPVGLAVSGGVGDGECGFLTAGTTAAFSGGSGAASALGGQGAGYSSQGGSTVGAANTGAGGGGGYTPNLTAARGGAGGGSGGFCDVIITSPLASYAYSVGAGGTLGALGTNGYVGAAGGSGGIWVYEFYF